MNSLQEKLVSYVSKLIGVTIKLELWPKATSLPRFLFDSYDFYSADFLDAEYLFLLNKNEKENTPALIKKHILLIKEMFAGEIVWVCQNILQHSRNRFIEYKIAFIIPDNQLYLPASGIALREYFRQARKEKRQFSPSAQVVVLNALTSNFYGPITSAHLVNQLHYSAMTLTRAIDEIELSGIGMIEAKGRERILLFTAKNKDLWQKALPFFRSPVKKVIYLHSKEPPGGFLKAGLTALAKHSMITDPELVTYALTAGQLKALQLQNHIEILPYPEAKALCFEIWRYAPELIGKNSFVDPLSLYLSHKDSSDERVVAEAQTMLEDFFDKRN